MACITIFATHATAQSNIPRRFVSPATFYYLKHTAIAEMYVRTYLLAILNPCFLFFPVKTSASNINRRGPRYLLSEREKKAGRAKQNPR